MKIRGEIADIRFRNDENGYTVAILDVDGEFVTCAGVFPTAIEGQSVEAEGQFSVHPKFGRQFKATSVKEVRPETEDGIIRYLGSGIIKGIGPVLAMRIVSVFGAKTFEVIEYTPHLLSTVSGISKKKAQEISESYGKIKIMQDAVMFLQSYGLTINMAMKIYSVYGKDTVSEVSRNPYSLIEDVDGIGFFTADKIAVALGVEHNGNFRVRAGIIFTLKESSISGGNTYLPKCELIEETARLLKVDESLIDQKIDELTMERKLKSFEFDQPSIMLTSLYRVEKSVAVGLMKLLEYSDKLEYDCDGEIEHYQKLHGITFHENQKKAISNAVNSGAVLITGGPGTGKTTIIKCILDILEKLNLTYSLMAPTGRAAKRMSEATGREARTIHRALGLGRENEAFGESEPLTADVVIVDEFSMVDVFLMRTLVERIKEGTRLVLVGDKDQLPSVGAGNVLADIKNSGLIPTVELNNIYRQAMESLIVTNAHAINRGEMPVLTATNKDFFFMKANSPDLTLNKIVETVSVRLPKYLNLSPDRIQVLCPLKNGTAGVINVNNVLQSTLNGDKTEKITSDDYSYAVGDKVMHTVNNYDLEWKIYSGYNVVDGSGVFNGDIGYIIDVQPSRRELTVEFEDGRTAVYTGELITQLQLAYAITVHKSQGSEFDAVVMPVVSGAPIILTRNLLYTAITRAKKLVVLIGEEYNVKRMVHNDYVAKRYSALKIFLEDAKYEINSLFGDK